jgi:hypothetical protein
VLNRILSLLLTFALLGVAAVIAQHERTYRQLAAGLDRDLAAQRHAVWERSALRGKAEEGNAALEAFAAVAGFPPLDAALRAGLAERVYYGQLPNADEVAAIGARQAALRALRASTQKAWAFTELAIELGPNMRVPNYARVVDAGLCLLADARRAPPAECLRMATDVIRLGQDLVPGAPLEAASAAARLTSLAARVIPRCALEADLPALRRSVHELYQLATHPAPTGGGIELQQLVAAMTLRDAAALTNKSGPREVLDTLLERPALLRSWKQIADATRFRRLSPTQYPDAVEEWKREQDFRSNTGLPLVLGATGDVLDRLHEDMRGQALVRMLAVGVATLAERAYRGKLPDQPATLHDPALIDPFRGGPLGFRLNVAASELTLWAVGEDHHDDGGASDYRDAAPIDVVTRFALARVEPRASR